MSGQSQSPDLCAPLSGNARLRSDCYLPRYTRREGTNTWRNCLAPTDGECELGAKPDVFDATPCRVEPPDERRALAQRFANSACNS